MSRKRIKKKPTKTPSVKELKALRQRIQKSMVETDEAVTEIEALDAEKVIDSFIDIT